MKTFIPLLWALLASIPAAAQFTLTGKIEDYTGKEKVTVNIPVIYGFDHENSLSVPVSATGEFSVVLPVDSMKFATLIFRRQFYTLLLTKDKQLHVRLQEQDKTLELLTGNALPENKLLRQCGMDDVPFFLQHADAYDSVSFAGLHTKLILPYQAAQAAKLAMVNTSRVPQPYRQLIASEVKYITFNYLNDFARVRVNDRAVIDSFLLCVFDGISNEPEVFPAGPQYYTFVDNYIRFLETKAFIRIRQEKIPPHEQVPYFGISLDSATVLVNKYGKDYWRWIGNNLNTPPAVTEVYTYQRLINLYNSKDLAPMQGLAGAFRKRFPASVYNADISSKINTLVSTLRRNGADTAIALVKDYNKVQSIYDVVNALKGNVVYLDVWGTWCGPCKEELKHVPQLRAEFGNKNVVFLYLDMDEEHRDDHWRQFILVNGLKGLHFRKNRQTIEPLWKELLEEHYTGRQSYPSYFIFDKAGRLVVRNALRPSDGEALYKQINTILAQ
jgi:thiol-disulfide isomerase/thioredoxin